MTKHLVKSTYPEAEGAPRAGDTGAAPPVPHRGRASASAPETRPGTPGRLGPAPKP